VDLLLTPGTSGTKSTAPYHWPSCVHVPISILFPLILQN
jgi:hypothetical protein